MAGLNKVQIIGNLGRDPEVKNLSGGGKVASFSVAVSEAYKNKAGERVSNTEWFNVQVWGNLAGVAEQYLTKGSKVYIEGKQKTETWENEAGETRSKPVLVGLSFLMLDSKGSNSEQKPSKPSRRKEAAPISEDELPF